MSVSITLLRPLSLELKRRGIDPWDLLADIGVDKERLSDSHEVISMHVLDTWLVNALALYGDTSLGLRAGIRAPLQSLIGIGPLLQSCNSLREALALLRRYAHAFARCLHWTVSEDGANAALICTLDLTHGPLRVQLEDFVVGLAYKLLRTFLSIADLAMSEVHLAHARPRHGDEYREQFSCTTRFCAPVSAVVFPRERLDEPNPYADPLVHALFGEYLEAVLRNRKGKNYEERVRFAIRQGLVRDQMNVRAVADAVGLSARALRRKLQDDGTNASMVIGEERERLAYRELARHDITIKQVSSELGFSEPSSFHRAFKRWSGVTPSEFKRSLNQRSLVVARQASRAGGGNPSGSGPSNV